MGGEWEFSIKLKEKRTTGFDLKQYQDELRRFKATSESDPSFEDGQLVWAKDEAQAHETNIFATFQYDCTRHTFHSGKANWKLYWDPTKERNDPRHLTSDVHARCAPGNFIRASLHFQKKLCRLFPGMFEYELSDGPNGYDCDGYASSRQREEEEEFTPPSGYAGGFAGYHTSSTSSRYHDYDRYEQEEEEFTPYSGMYLTGNGDMVYAVQGESSDLTACDKECGYCGRCRY